MSRPKHHQGTARNLRPSFELPNEGADPDGEPLPCHRLRGHRARAPGRKGLGFTLLAKNLFCFHRTSRLSLPVLCYRKEPDEDPPILAFFFDSLILMIANLPPATPAPLLVLSVLYLQLSHRDNYSSHSA